MGKVLVVDDDSKIRSIVQEYLGSRGYEIVEAENGTIALDLLERGNGFDVILLDLYLPDTSGEEILEILNSRAIQTTVIVLTGYCNRAENLKDHGRRVLCKPIALQDLYQTIRELLGEPERRKEM